MWQIIISRIRRYVTVACKKISQRRCANKGTRCVECWRATYRKASWFRREAKSLISPETLEPNKILRKRRRILNEKEDALSEAGVAEIATWDANLRSHRRIVWIDFDASPTRSSAQTEGNYQHLLHTHFKRTKITATLNQPHTQTQIHSQWFQRRKASKVR